MQMIHAIKKIIRPEISIQFEVGNAPGKRRPTKACFHSMLASLTMCRWIYMFLASHLPEPRGGDQHCLDCVLASTTA